VSDKSSGDLPMTDTVGVTTRSVRAHDLDRCHRPQFFLPSFPVFHTSSLLHCHISPISRLPTVPSTSSVPRQIIARVCLGLEAKFPPTCHIRGQPTIITIVTDPRMATLPRTPLKIPIILDRRCLTSSDTEAITGFGRPTISY
jgi:hypothetical protein